MAVKKELETLVVYLSADAQKYNQVLMGAEKRLEAFDTHVQKLGHSLDNVVASVTSKTSSLASVAMGEVTKTLDTVQAKVRQVAASLSKPIIIPVVFQFISPNLSPLGAGKLGGFAGRTFPSPFDMSMPVPPRDILPKFGAGGRPWDQGFFSPSASDMSRWNREKAQSLWASGITSAPQFANDFVGPPRPPVGRTTMAGGDFGDGIRHLWGKMPSQATVEQTLIAPLRGRLRASIDEVGTLMTSTFGTFRSVMRQVIYASVGAYFLTMLMSPLVAFDTTMTQVMAKMRGGFEGMRPYAEKQILGMANRGVATPTDLAGALGVLGRSGLSARDSLENLAVVERFAAANSMTATDSANSLSRALNALGLISNDSGRNLDNFTRLSDLLTKASGLTNVSVDELASGLGGKNSASIKQLGISLEDSVAYLIAFNKASGSGTVSMGQMHAVLNELQKSVIQHPAAWRNYVQVFEPVTGKMRDLGDIVADLEKNFHGLSDWERFVSEKNLGLSSTTRDAIGSLLGMSATLKTVREQLDGAAGETGRMADIMGKTFGHAFANLKNQAIILSMSLGNVLAPMVVSLAGAVRDGVKAWMDLSEGQRRAFVTMGLVLLALAPVIWMLRTVFALANVVLFPFIALTKVLMGLGAAVVAVTYDFGQLIYTVAKSILHLTFAIPLAFIKELLLLLPEAMAGVGRVAMSIGTSVAAAVGPLLALLSPLLFIALGIAAIAGGIKVMSGLWSNFKGSASSAMDTVKVKAGETWASITDGAEGFVDKAIGFFANFQENVKIFMAWLKDNWRELLVDVLSLISKAGSNIWDNAKIGAAYLADYIGYLFDQLWKRIKRGFMELWEEIKAGGVTGDQDAIKAVIRKRGDAQVQHGDFVMQEYTKLDAGMLRLQQLESIVTKARKGAEFLPWGTGFDEKGQQFDISKYREEITFLRSLAIPESVRKLRGLEVEGVNMGRNTPLPGMARRRVEEAESYLGIPKANLLGIPPVPVFKGLLDGFDSIVKKLPAFNTTVAPDKSWMLPPPNHELLEKEDWAKGRMAGNMFPGTFKEISLRRFNLSGAGGLSRDPSQVPEQSVHDKKNHDVLQELRRQNQPAPVKAVQ